MTERAALLSIHPRFAERIMGGSKRVEFRKRGFGRKVDYVVVYATQPVGQVLGFFSVDEVVSASPMRLWADFCTVGGIAGDEFWRYYQGVEEGWAIRVGEVWQLTSPLALSELEVTTAPQSYAYLPPAQLGRLRRSAELLKPVQSRR